MRIIIEDILTITMNKKREIGNFSILIENGKIELLAKKGIKRKPGDYIINGKNKVAIPGLINGHIHSDITLARGLGDGLTLYEQDCDSYISRKKWFTDELDEEARYYGRLLQYSEALKGGTVFICDVPFWHYGDDLLTPLKEAGIKAALVLDYRKNFLTGEMIEKNHYFEKVQTLKDNGYIPIVEAPAEEGLGEKLLRMLAKWAQELDTFIQMHLAETPWRVKITEERFGRTPVRYLSDIKFLNSRVIGSHGIYIDDEELAMIKDAGVRIVNCPTTEMKISDGIAPVYKFIKQSIPFGIGTDGALWNDSADMFSEMKNLMLLQRVSYGASSIDAYSCLYSATMGGAKVFGLEKESGSIEKGKRAHIVLIDLFKPHLLPAYHGKSSNIVQIITSCARASDVETVIIDGNITVEHGKLLTMDEDSLKSRCQELGEKRFHDLE